MLYYVHVVLCDAEKLLNTPNRTFDTTVERFTRKRYS